MTDYDHAAEFHKAVVKASTSNNRNIRAAYFDLAVFHYRHVNMSSKQNDDAHVLRSIAEDCCHEQHCWCKEDSHAK